LDEAFPIAKPEEYIIRWGGSGEDLPMTKELKETDSTARGWLAGAEFDRWLGNSLVNSIERGFMWIS
jgi:hypothetical protein